MMASHKRPARATSDSARKSPNKHCPESQVLQYLHRKTRALLAALWVPRGGCTQRNTYMQPLQRECSRA